MQITWLTWVRQVWTITKKDLLSESRTPHGVGTVLAFALVALFIVSFNLGGALLSSLARTDKAIVLAAMLWVILFFSALSGLSRSFTREEDVKTAGALKLTAIPTAVYGGKLLYNILLMIAVEILTIPLFVVLMNVHVSNWSTLLGGVIWGTLGLTATGTMLAAMVAKATVRTTLFGVIAFPLILPLLVFAINAASVGFGAEFDASGSIRVMGAYTVVSVTASLLLFEPVWRGS